MLLSQHQQQTLRNATWKARSYGLENAELLLIQRYVEDLAGSSQRPKDEDFHLLSELCSALIHQMVR